jgi:hypothetical protein
VKIQPRDNKLLLNVVMSDLNWFAINPYFNPCKKEEGRLLSCDAINKPEMIGQLFLNYFIIHHSMKIDLVLTMPLQEHGIKRCILF